MEDLLSKFFTEKEIGWMGKLPRRYQYLLRLIMANRIEIRNLAAEVKRLKEREG